jgi:aspartate carbamoyltransferase catalytic subunit
LPELAGASQGVSVLIYCSIRIHSRVSQSNMRLVAAACNKVGLLRPPELVRHYRGLEATGAPSIKPRALTRIP